jgi:hypothetical protein
MSPIYHIKEKEGRGKKRLHININIKLLEIKDGLSREQTLDGITDSESCLLDMKRNLRIILDCTN